MAQSAGNKNKGHDRDWPQAALDLQAQPSLLGHSGRRDWFQFAFRGLAGLSLAAALLLTLPALRPGAPWLRAALVVTLLSLLLDLGERLQLRPLRLRAREAWREATSLALASALLGTVVAQADRADPVLAATLLSPLILLAPLMAASLLPLRPALLSSLYSALLLGLMYCEAPCVQNWQRALGWFAAPLILAGFARLRLFAATQRVRDRAEVDSSMRLQRLLDDARSYRLTGARGEADFSLKRPLAGALAIRENINNITELTHRFFKASSSQLWWLDEAHKQLVLRAQRGDAAMPADSKVGAGFGLLGSVLKTRAPINLHHLRSDFEGLSFYPDKQAPPAVLAVPVLEGEHPRGVLLVDRVLEDASFSRTEQALLASLADQIMHAVKVERVFAVMEKDQHSQDALLQLTEALNKALTLDASLDALVQGVQNMSQADLAAVVLLQNKKLVVSRLAGTLADQEKQGQELDPSASLVGSALRSQVALPARAELLGSDRRIVLLSDNIDPRGLRRGKVIPLLHQGEAIGALVLAARQSDRLGDEVIRLLQVAAGYAAISLVNAKLYAKMEHMATRDGLTGLINHRSFQEQLAGALERSKRFNQALSLMLCDIDHFKNVNDTYGHPTGDEVLRRVSAALVEESRTTDVVARYGGEEFTIIMEATDPKGAMQVAERIRRSVQAQQTETANGPLKVTLSAGLATFPQDAEQQADLIKAADETLYLAKNQGRNRCLHRQHTRGNT